MNNKNSNDRGIYAKITTESFYNFWNDDRYKSLMNDNKFPLKIGMSGPTRQEAEHRDGRGAMSSSVDITLGFIVVPEDTNGAVDNLFRKRLLSENKVIKVNIESNKFGGEYVLVDINISSLKIKDINNIRDLAKLSTKKLENVFKLNLFKDLIQNIMENFKEIYMVDKPLRIFSIQNKQKTMYNFLDTYLKSGSPFYLNVDAATRIGKTLITLTAMKDNNVTPIWIGKNLTSHSSAIKDHKDFYLGEMNLGIFSLNINTNIKTKFEVMIKDNDIIGDVVLIIDEVDDKTHTLPSSEGLKIVIDSIKNSALNFRGMITMSATRAHRGIKLIRNVAGTNVEINNFYLPYYQMQELDNITTVPRHMIMIGIVTKNKFSFENSVNKINRKSLSNVAEFLLPLFGDVKRYNMMLNKDAPHIFVKYQANTNNSILSLIDMLENKNKNKNRIFFNMTGENTSNKEAEQNIKELEAKNIGKQIIIISKGMAATSFSVPTIGRTIIVGDTNANSYQVLHRSTTYSESIPGKVAQMIQITEIDNMNVYTPDPLFVETQRLNLEEKDLSKIYKKYLSDNTDNSIVYDHYDFITKKHKLSEAVNYEDMTQDETMMLIDMFNKTIVSRETIAMDLIESNIDVSVLSLKGTKKIKSTKKIYVPKVDCFGNEIKETKKDDNTGNKRIPKNEKIWNELAGRIMYSCIYNASFYDSFETNKFIEILTKRYEIPVEISKQILENKNILRKIKTEILGLGNLADSKLANLFYNLSID